MKKTFLILALLLPLAAAAQDSAEAVVQRYLKLLNYEALPADSLLVMETTVSFHGSDDTYTLRRLYAVPNMMRVEVWHGDTLTNGYSTNGGSRHREYSRALGWWNDAEHSIFHKRIDSYDFRGPLYRWRERGIKLTYMGGATTKGERLQVVRAEMADNYTRYYMFEQQSGLLVLMQERDEDTTNTNTVLKALRPRPIDYEVIHEYLPVGESLVPSEMSYMRDGLLTIMRTSARFEPRNDLLFNKD